VEENENEDRNEDGHAIGKNDGFMMAP